MITVLKSNKEANLIKVYKMDKEGLTQEILFDCEFEGMKITAEVFKIKKRKASIAFAIFDTEGNKSKLSFAANTKNKVCYTFAELPEKTIKKEKHVQLEIIPNNYNFAPLKYNYKKSDGETNKEWLKDACAKIITEVLLEAQSEKDKTPFDVEKFKTLSEKLNNILEDWNAKQIATRKEKDEAAKKLSEITNVALHIDPLSEILNLPKLRYNVMIYDEELERRFKDYEEGMSMQDFLRSKFGERAVELAKIVFGIED